MQCITSAVIVAIVRTSGSAYSVTRSHCQSRARSAGLSRAAAPSAPNGHQLGASAKPLNLHLVTSHECWCGAEITDIDLAAYLVQSQQSAAA